MNENAKLLIFYFAGNDFNYHFEQNSKYLTHNTDVSYSQLLNIQIIIY